MKFLLDTNVISELRKRERAHPSVVRWAAATPPTAMFTSVVVLAEIRRGIELKRRRDPRHADQLDAWFATMRVRLGARVYGVDEPIAETWARMSIPDPLPLVDGILAATAQVHGLTLVTRNVADVAGTGVAVIDPFSASDPLTP